MTSPDWSDRQIDSLDVLLLDEIFLQFNKGRNDLTHSFGY